MVREAWRGSRGSPFSPFGVKVGCLVSSVEKSEHARACDSGGTCCLTPVAPPPPATMAGQHAQSQLQRFRGFQESREFLVKSSAILVITQSQTCVVMLGYFFQIRSPAAEISVPPLRQTRLVICSNPRLDMTPLLLSSSSFFLSLCISEQIYLGIKDAHLSRHLVTLLSAANCKSVQDSQMFTTVVLFKGAFFPSWRSEEGEQ